MKAQKNTTNSSNPTATDILIAEDGDNKVLEPSDYSESDELWDILSASSTKKPSELFSHNLIAHIEGQATHSPEEINTVPISKWNQSKTWLAATAAACIITVLSYNAFQSNNDNLANQSIEEPAPVSVAQIADNSEKESEANLDTVLTEDFLVALFENTDQIKDDEIYALLSF